MENEVTVGGGGVLGFLRVPFYHSNVDPLLVEWN